MSVRDSYDAAASAYADHLFTELEQKPLDRHLLNRFAEATRGRGQVVDLGCGPGHVAKYLREQGVSVIGVDLSAEMVKVAGNLCPGIDFRIGDMRRLNFEDSSLAGVVAFYSIVHFDPAELGTVFQEMRRVLRQDGLALISFHVGDQVVHVDDLFGAPVSLDFRFHVPDQVIEALRLARFHVVEEVEREPYEGAEYPSRRCYLLASAGEKGNLPMSTRSTRISRHVNAPRADVYRALLDARAVATWMVPVGMTSHVHEFDPREGGLFRISLTYDEPTGSGKSTEHTDTYHGHFVKLVPDEQVVEVMEFETADDAMRGEMTVTFTLVDADGGTDVLAVHDNLPPGLSPADNETGWRMSLDKLAAFVEGHDER